MVHFEFGQDRLTEPHPLNAFELAWSASTGPYAPLPIGCQGVGMTLHPRHFALRNPECWPQTEILTV